MAFLRLRFFPAGDAGPVRDFMEALAKDRPAAYAKIRLDLEMLSAEGLRSGRITLRSLGRGLWELKRGLEGIQYRIFICVDKGSAWLLHVLEKKSSRTPLNDLGLARKRMRMILQ